MNNISKLRNTFRSGPASPPLIGRNRYTDAAVTIPFIPMADGLHLLFEQRAANIPQGGEICFPGGVFDPNVDRSLQDTAMRETAEELGIGRENVEILGVLGTVVTLRGHAVDCFPALLRINDITDIVIDSNEVTRVFTLPLAWFFIHEPEYYPLHVELHPHTVAEDGNTVTLLPAEKLGLPELYWQSWRMKKKEVLVYRTDEGPIWGMTAQVIEELVRRHGK